VKLQDQVAIVTGAGSGMGKAIATLFAQEGAKVVVADINQAGIEEVVAEIRENGGTALGALVNMADETQVQAMIDTAVEQYGSLDILINNAGIMDNFVPVADVSNDLWERVISVNLKGPFMASRAALSVMLKQSKGVIVNTASVGGLFGTRGGASYTISKHGVLGLTKNIAATYGKMGIRCNAIAPGGVNTNIGSTITAPHPLGLESMTKGTGEAPMGQPMEIAQIALFLASSDASFINGATVVADGGWTVY